MVWGPQWSWENVNRDRIYIREGICHSNSYKAYIKNFKLFLCIWFIILELTQKISGYHIDKLYPDKRHFKNRSTILYNHTEENIWRKVKVEAAQSCLILGNPVGYIVDGILQARILEWVAIPFSRGSSNPGIEPRSPALQVDSLPAELPRMPY